MTATTLTPALSQREREEGKLPSPSGRVRVRAVDSGVALEYRGDAEAGAPIQG